MRIVYNVHVLAMTMSTWYFISSIFTSKYFHCCLLQFLMGIFYYIEAAVLLEDFEGKLNHTTYNGMDGYINDVEYYKPGDVTHAYQVAA